MSAINDNVINEIATRRQISDAAQESRTLVARLEAIAFAKEEVIQEIKERHKKAFQYIVNESNGSKHALNIGDILNGEEPKS